MAEKPKTPGQIAYESYEKFFGRDGSDWNCETIPQSFRDGWEAAITGAFPRLLEELKSSQGVVRSLVDDRHVFCENSRIYNERASDNYREIYELHRRIEKLESELENVNGMVCESMREYGRCGG